MNLQKLVFGSRGGQPPIKSSNDLSTPNKRVFLMKHESLIGVARHLGYTDTDIAKIVQALDGGGVVIRAQADTTHHDLKRWPTPLQAAAESPDKLKIIHKTRGMIRHISSCRYDLPMDRPVDLKELNSAISAGPIEDRMAIKGNLALCGLIN